MIKIPDDMKAFIDNALADRIPCMLATASAKGYPRTSPKGSMIVYDDETLAYWERSQLGALNNIRENPHVAVYYRNPDEKDRLPRGACLRFYGEATVFETGPIREAVMARTVPAELERDPELIGFAVLIRVDLITDLQGGVVQTRDGN